MATIVALALVWCPASALADGDPASDVLAGQALFLPQDAGTSPGQAAQLSSLLTAARRHGYPIRVALIASSADLGSVTALWHQPESYARFLGQELALVYAGPLLVVMPNGYGVVNHGGGSTAQADTLAGLTAPVHGLVAGAVTAVRRLAGAAGHPLALPNTTVTPASGSASVIPWVVFVIGAGLIGAAWAASLRARPLRLGRE